MKRKTLIGIIIGLLVLLCGGVFFAFYEVSPKTGSANNVQASQYTQAMNKGKAYVDARKYEAAEEAFEDAYDAKPTETARAYAKQAEHLADAIDEALDAEYADAVKDASRAAETTNGYRIMTKQAKDYQDKFNECLENYQQEIAPLLRNAKVAENQNNYDDAIRAYQDILDLPYINGKYYQKIYKEVSDELEDVQEEKDEHPSANNSSSSTSTSNTSSNDRTVDGQTVSMSAIGQIRGVLQGLGVDDSSYSDQQIVDLFRMAAANGHHAPVQITKDDVQKYNQSIGR